MRLPLHTGLAFVVLAVAGCQTNPGSDYTSLGEVAPPMELDKQVDSTWVYLRNKYDTDGDDRITSQEYDREGGRFDRVDSNGDGVITAADFEQGRGRRMEGMRAQRIVAMYFQIDTPAELGLDELGEAITAYDDNADGRIDAEEFETHREDRKLDMPGGDSPMMRRRMGNVDAWEAMIVVIDTDNDGRITRAEFIAFFKDRDDGDLVWSLDRSRRGGAGPRRGEARSGRGEATSRPMSGAPEGRLAPDFTLGPPHGGETVTLSSFSKNLPVALIFGSYT